MKPRRQNRRGDQRSSKRRGRGRLRRWLIVSPLALVAVITLLWSMPLVVAHTELKQKIVSAALSDFEGSVTIGTASLGWTSPLLARNIEAYDRNGQPLAHVDSVRSEKWLIGLLADRSRPGPIHVEKPTVHVTMRDGGSNWQDALAGYLTNSDAGTPMRGVTVHVVEGQVEIQDRVAGTQWRVSQLNGSLQYVPDEAVPIALRAAGTVAADGQPPGNVSIDLAWQPAGNTSNGLGEGRLTVHGEALPLAPIAAAARDVVGQLRVQGTASGDAVCRWSESQGSREIRIDNLTADNVSLTGDGWSGEDRLQTKRLRGSTRLASDGQRWHVEQLVLDTDFAKLEARGAVPTAEFNSADFWSRLAGYLSRDEVHVRADVDLVQLAQMLPSTLHLHPATELASGTAGFAIDSLRGDESGFSIELKLNDLAAADGQDTLQPILLAAKVRFSPEHTTIDRMVCQSSFLTLTAQGTLSEGSAVIEGDLEQMAQEVGQFIDFGGCTLAGRLDGDLRWRQATGDVVAAEGRLDLEDFELSLPANDRWTERHLAVALRGEALVRQGRLDQIRAGSISMESGNDRLVATLAAPVDRPGVNATWPLACQINGQLATWTPRLRPILSTRPWALSGGIDLAATATLAPKMIDAQSVTLQIEDFQARKPDLVIDEPAIRLQAAGSWDVARQRVTARDATLTSSTVAFRARQVLVQLPPEPLAASGSLSYRGSLERLSRFWQQSTTSPQNQLTGTVSGVVQASYEAGTTQLDWDGEAKDLLYASRSAATQGGNVMAASHRPAMREVWREPVVKLVGRQRYDQKRDALDIEQIELQAQSLRLAARGRIEGLCERPVADLRGEFDCDLADLSTKLQPWLGPNIQLAGRDKSPFSIQGPLTQLSASTLAPDGRAMDKPPSAAPSAADGRPKGTTGSLLSPDLSANARLAWQSANIHGLLIGRGDLAASLGEGIIRFAPLDVPVSEGRLLTQAEIDLRAQPAMLRVQKGPLIENVRISPQMCQTWLKYVAPLLADATRAEGRFSVALDSARVPLPDQTRSDVHGALTIHNAHVGPGPLAQQFISLAEQVKSLIEDGTPGSGTGANSTWLVVPEQTVPFDIDKGRVRHRNLIVTSGDVQIKTSGTVGFDETLDLVAEVPVQDAWVAGKAYLTVLKGTTIRVPVRGTLSSPKLDANAVRELSRQMLGGAARRALEGELNRGLQRLFGQ